MVRTGTPYDNASTIDIPKFSLLDGNKKQSEFRKMSSFLSYSKTGSKMNTQSSKDNSGNFCLDFILITHIRDRPYIFKIQLVGLIIDQEFRSSKIPFFS